MKNGIIKKFFSKFILVLAIFLLLVGIIIFIYPMVSNFFAEKNQMEVINNYIDVVAKNETIDFEKELQKAERYNQDLAGAPVKDPFVEGSGYVLPDNYKQVLSFTEDGIIAYIRIPKIKVNLPIYHGTDEEIMEKGVGHIQYTSLPIGANSSHSILTGHRGLPSAQLFTRLDELEIGDLFYINILDKTLAYKIYNIKVVLPTELEDLQIEKDRDLITLVTCTPYGVNTHRLLVQGERTEYIEAEQKEIVSSKENTVNSDMFNIKNHYLKGVIIGIVFLIFLKIFFKKLRKK